MLALLLVAIGCTGDGTRLERITFLTNYVFIGRHAPFFVGLDKGFYRDAGLDVQILPATGSAFVITALESGQADYGIAEAASVVQAVGKGAGVKAFGVFMDRSTSGLAALAPYPEPRTLIARTVAASLTDGARVILPIVFEQAGIEADSVEWLAADPSTYSSLLLSGRADLITASIDSDVPALQRVAGPQGHEVHFASFADWGYEVYGYFLISRADRVASSPDQVRAFAAATVRAVEYAVEHPEEAAEILTRHSPALDAEMARAQWEASIDALSTPYVDQHGYGAATPERLQRSIDLVSQAFGLDPRPTPEDVYAGGLMPR